MLLKPPQPVQQFGILQLGRRALVQQKKINIPGPQCAQTGREAVRNRREVKDTRLHHRSGTRAQASAQPWRGRYQQARHRPLRRQQRRPSRRQDAHLGRDRHTLTPSSQNALQSLAQRAFRLAIAIQPRCIEVRDALIQRKLDQPQGLPAVHPRHQPRSPKTKARSCHPASFAAHAPLPRPRIFVSFNGLICGSA